MFIHCVHGQSRSCAVCIAFLMNHYINDGTNPLFLQSPEASMNEESACRSTAQILHSCYNMVESARPSMAVNPGFVHQLEIFRLMKCIQKNLTTSDRDHRPIQSKAHAAFRSFRAKSEFYDNGTISKFCPLNVTSDSRIHVCKNCTATIATDSNVILDLSRDETSLLPASDYWMDSSGGKEYACIKKSNSARSNETFESTLRNAQDILKVEPMQWMRQTMVTADNNVDSRGILCCPNCTQHLGYWDWCQIDPFSSVVLLKARLDCRA